MRQKASSILIPHTPNWFFCSPKYSQWNISRFYSWLRTCVHQHPIINSQVPAPISSILNGPCFCTRHQLQKTQDLRSDMIMVFFIMRSDFAFIGRVSFFWVFHLVLTVRAGLLTPWGGLKDKNILSCFCEVTGSLGAVSILTIVSTWSLAQLLYAPMWAWGCLKTKVISSWTVSILTVMSSRSLLLPL